MPQTHPTASATGLAPVPVAVLLPPPGGRHAHSAGGAVPDWHGVTAREAAGLITRLSAVGDLVIELDGHPTILRAAEYHHRRFAAAFTDGPGLARPAPGRTQQTRRSPLAGLIFAALPRPGVEPGDLNAISAAMHTWRSGLRPAGYLLTVLTLPSGSDLGDAARPVSHRATVIAAARTAGFTWQQEFLVLTAPLPDGEPRALPDAPADLPAALADGRHQRIHVNVLAFRNDGGGSNA
jgi:hypothetical protein